ncbi:MAG: PAS domain-containing protein [Actinomycetota bacterium]
MALQRNSAERSLREQEEWLRVTLASIGDAVITTDTRGRVTYLNPVAQALSGWTQEDALGKPLENVFRIINDRTRETVENPAESALRRGQVVGLANHTLLIARDGTERPIDDSAAPILGANGAVIGAILVFRDITERYRTEQEAREREQRLGESEARFRQLADAMPPMVWSARSDGRLDYFNHRWYEFTGLPDGPASEGEAPTWAPVLHPDEVQSCLAAWSQAVSAGVPFEREYRLWDRHRGQYRWRHEPAPSCAGSARGRTSTTRNAPRSAFRKKRAPLRPSTGSGSPWRRSSIWRSWCRR